MSTRPTTGSLTAVCHCGDVRVTVPRQPRNVFDCNCSICRRYGVLWAYYKPQTVRIETPRKNEDEYRWRTKRLRFARCARCGCLMYWQLAGREIGTKMGVNARCFDPSVLSNAAVIPIDGASYRS